LPVCRAPSTGPRPGSVHQPHPGRLQPLAPASPLDGGRVLHAALWRAKGDYAWATRVASEIGQGFGYLFIALGIVMFIFQGSFSGAWLAGASLDHRSRASA
jgi:hypothetical protein